MPKEDFPEFQADVNIHEYDPYDKWVASRFLRDT